MCFPRTRRSFKSLPLAMVLSAAAANQLLAADLPPTEPSYQPVQYSAVPSDQDEHALPGWQGFHVGIVGSNSQLSGKSQFTNGTTRSFDAEGYALGVLAGADAQFDAVVLGLEADTSFGNIAGRSGTSGSDAVVGEVGQFSTLRGRVGFTPAPNVLFYATGGLALADMAVRTSQWGTDKELVTGFTYGGGIEAKLTDNISLRGEYLYTQLDPKRFDFSVKGSQGMLSTSDFHTFRAALVYQLPAL